MSSAWISFIGLLFAKAFACFSLLFCFKLPSTISLKGTVAVLSPIYIHRCHLPSPRLWLPHFLVENLGTSRHHSYRMLPLQLQTLPRRIVWVRRNGIIIFEYFSAQIAKKSTRLCTCLTLFQPRSVFWGKNIHHVDSRWPWFCSPFSPVYTLKLAIIPRTFLHSQLSTLYLFRCGLRVLPRRPLHAP